MPLTFGDHASEGGTNFEPGMYDAIVKSVNLVLDPATSEPKLNINNKKQVDVLFDVQGELIKRRYPIGFGQNNANGQWAAFAKFIEAVTGIRCGDAEQRQVTDTQLLNRRVRIVVETNDRGYSDVTNIMKSSQPQPKAKPQPVAANQSDSNESSEWANEEVPF